MSNHSIDLKKIEKAIKALSPDEQKILLTDLARLLDLAPEDISMLKAAEPAFDFWDNPEDSVYDSL